MDDDEINLQTLYQTLDGQGYNLLIARSGEDALRIARKANPDLILLDIMMPGLDGYETCAQLKADERTKRKTTILLMNNYPIERFRSIGGLEAIP